MERVLPDRRFELNGHEFSKADELHAILSFAWPEIPKIAGNGKTLEYLLELSPDRHPVWTFQHGMNGSDNILKALAIDLSVHPNIQESSQHDLYQSIEQSLHIIYARSCSVSSRGSFHEMSAQTRLLVSHTARLLAQDGNPVRPVFDRQDIDIIDPYSHLL